MIYAFKIDSSICNLKAKLWALFFFSLVFQLLSCSYSNRLDGYIYYRLNSNPSTLDPALIVDVTGGLLAAKIFNGLVRLDKDMRISRDIAETWNISNDGLTYTFTLRPGVKFSNNQAVTASDFKYSFKRILDPHTHSPNTWVFEKIAGARDFMEGRAKDLSGISALNDHTLELKLEKPFAPFIYLLTMSAAYVVPEEEVKKWGKDFSSHPAGTGPFMLASWHADSELKLERRENYFGDTAKAKGIIYRVIPEELTAITEFELGNLDVITIPAAEFSKFRSDPKWKTLVSPVKGINTYYIGMNCGKPPFDNINVRKAVSLALDKKSLLATFYEKRGRLASGPVPDNLRKWPEPPFYEYSPEKASEIIKREGFAGKTLNFYITSDQEVVDMAEFVQAYLKKAGLEVKIKQLEWSAYKEAINKGEADMFWLSWWADYPDPENFLFPLFHSSNIGPAGNRTRYSNPTVDKILESCQSEIKEEKKNSCYEQAERLIVSEAPWVFFWHKTDYVVRQSWIKDYKAYPIYSMDKGTSVQLLAADLRR